MLFILICATDIFSLFLLQLHPYQGLKHDRGTENDCTSTASNYGWRDPSAEFRSILSYDCKTGQCDNMPKDSCPRVQRFSNTINLYNEKAMGSPQHDNASNINNVKATIAQYRTVMVQPETSQVKILLGNLSFSFFNFN